MKILLDNNIPALADIFRASGADVHTRNGREITSSDVADCTALFVRSITPVAQSLLKDSPVRFVATATSGIDHIDTTYLEHRNIVFADAKGCNAQAVAEYVLHGILLYAQHHQCNLRTMRIGVIGYGECGSRVVRLLNVLGMQEVLVHDPYVQARGILLPQNTTWTHLETIYHECTVITNHIPLIPETQGLIGQSAISAISQGALMIHASRGGIVDEHALVHAIQSHRCSAIVDVWQNEPMVHHALVQSALLATPHIAGYTQEGKLRGSMMVLHSFLQWMQQAEYDHTIDTALLDNAYAVMYNDTLFQGKRSVNVQYPAEEILSALQEARPLQEDDQLLRSCTDKTDAEIRQVFDLRRKHYPRSREVFSDVSALC